MEKTVVADWIGRDDLPSYGVFAFLSPRSQEDITALTAHLKHAFPDALWTLPPEQGHITLFEIIMAFRDYDEDKDRLYEKHKETIDRELTAALAGQGPITVRFDTLDVSPNAIIVKGTDDGSFQRIRDHIVAKNILPAGTRRPPDIIHSTIARFTQELDLAEVQKTVAGLSTDFEEIVQEFTLARISRQPMEHEVLKTFPLRSAS